MTPDSSTSLREVITQRWTTHHSPDEVSSAAEIVPLTQADNGSALYWLAGLPAETQASVVSAAVTTQMIDGYAASTTPDTDLLDLLIELVAPHRIGIRVSLGDPETLTASLPTQAVVAVPLSEEVRIRGLISARNVPTSARIGVVDAASGALDLQDITTLHFD